MSILQGRRFEVSEILRHGGKKSTPTRALYSNRLKNLYLIKLLKSSISHSSMSSHVRTRARSTTLLAIWNLLLVQLCRVKFPPFWLLLQGTVTLWAVPSRVISPIRLRLQGMTRAWMRTKICAEKQATAMAVFFVASVEPRTDVFGSSRHSGRSCQSLASPWKRALLVRKIQVGACGNTAKNDSAVSVLQTRFRPPRALVWRQCPRVGCG